MPVVSLLFAVDYSPLFMFLDFGAGILSAIAASEFFGVPLAANFLFAGIIFSVLPDADFFAPLLARRSFGGLLRHREGLHYPLLYIPAGMILFSFFGREWGVLFGLASFAHFLHDSIGIGWGVQWLYPFSKNHYSFLYLYKPRFRKEKLPRKLLYVWKNGEIEEIDAKFGDPDWIKNVYFKWHPYAIIEMMAFLAALIVLISYAR